MSLAALLILAFLVPAEGEDLQDSAAEAVVVAEEGTLGYFAPKTDLENVRFVIADAGAYRVELASDQETLLQAFLRRFRSEVIDRPWLADPTLTQEEENWLFDRIPERPDDPFAVLIPDQRAAGRATLNHLTFSPTGDGGYRGLMGILSLDTQTRQAIGETQLSERNLCVVALAYPCDTKPTFLPMLCAGVTQEGREERDKLSAFFAGLTFDETPELVDVQGLFVEYPTTPGLICTLKVGSKRYLSCLKKHAEDYTPVPFSAPYAFSPFSDSPNGLLLFEEPEGETDTSLFDSAYFILPDVDGNACPEILVRSTISMLYAIEREPGTAKNYKIVLKKYDYRGP